MIILNGSKFAENDTEATEEIKGYAKRLSRQIKLFNIKRELIGVINRHDVLCCATKVDGGYWYSYADIKEIGDWKSYMDKIETIQALVTSRDGSGNYYL